MSRRPMQQREHSESKYPNILADERENWTSSTHARLVQEPPRYLYPESQNLESTYMPSAQYRLPSHGKAFDGDDHAYSVSPSNTTFPPMAVQRSSVSRTADNFVPSSPYLEFVHGRGSIGSTGGPADLDSVYSSSSATFPSPVHSERSTGVPSGTALPTHPARRPPRQGTSNIHNVLNPSSSPSPPPRKTSTVPRYHLHIRQQPIAARACGAGDRDRRPVDPPPIVQMLLTDFNPASPDDQTILQDPRFTVGCLLFPMRSSSNPTPTTPENREPDSAIRQAVREGRLNTGSQRSGPVPVPTGDTTPLLSGKSFVSPFYVDADPDPDTAPFHPSSNPAADNQRQSSSSNSENPSAPASDSNSNEKPGLPSTFYIFSDLSIRTAGLYRFQFRLMNWGSVEDTGQSMPILAEAWSEPFRVYPAKDFPGMRDSSPLTEGLKELGFVELKTRGKGKGKGRRPR